MLQETSGNLGIAKGRSMLRKQKRPLTLLLILTILPWLQSIPVAYAHRIPVPLAPVETSSFYMGTMDNQRLYSKGCDQGRRSSSEFGGPGPRDGLVILAFGQPTYENSQYGTYIYDAQASFYSTTQIGNAVKEFARGFWICTPFNGPTLKIAIGTSNLGTRTNFYDHGRAWAQMVNNVANYVRDQSG